MENLKVGGKVGTLKGRFLDIFMTDIRQSERYASYMTYQGWIVKRIDGINYFIRKFPVIGAFLKIQRPQNIDLTTIDILSRKYGVIQIILEPNLTTGFNPAKYHDLLSTHGYKLKKSTYLPSKTLQINLKQSEDQIFNNFKKDARASIRKGSGLAIKEYSTPSEIKNWRDAWKKSVNFQKYVPTVGQLYNLKKAFRNNHSLILASHNIFGSIIGGALFTRSSHDVAYYWYGFTSKEGRTSLSQYSLLYQGILWGKSQGCKVFDLEGIYDPRFPNKSWLGFSHFKKSFGGREIQYPGCYSKLRIHF